MKIYNGDLFVIKNDKCKNVYKSIQLTEVHRKGFWKIEDITGLIIHSKIDGNIGLKHNFEGKELKKIKIIFHLWK
jgi:hypothetical protein